MCQSVSYMGAVTSTGCLSIINYYETNLNKGCLELTLDITAFAVHYFMAVLPLRTSFVSLSNKLVDQTVKYN